MNYGKSLITALVFDLAWLMGSPAATMGPGPLPVQEVVAERSAPPGAQLAAVGREEDSLMTYLREHPRDVDAMAQLADIYVEHAWFDNAIGPLARALQLDPSRRRLWVDLDKAVEQSGRGTITDAELTRRAAQFVDAVSMWGHGC